MASVDLASITSSTTASLDYAGYLIDATNGTITLTLPDMAGVGDGASLILARTDININVNVVIMPTNTTILSAPYLIIPILTSYTINYFNGVWRLTEANDALLTYNYKFDYIYFFGIPTIYGAFEDIMDIITLTEYDDSSMLVKINSTLNTF